MPDPIQKKITKAKKDGDLSQMIEHLPRGSNYFIANSPSPCHLPKQKAKQQKSCRKDCSCVECDKPAWIPELQPRQEAARMTAESGLGWLLSHIAFISM
jgi:hypothetical protein